MVPISTKNHKGMVVAPDARAAEAGEQVLAEGGNAVEAAVAATATLAVIYPHMCGLGGDSFWLIANAPGRGNVPQVIDASGASANWLSPEYYTSQGYGRIPERGPQAALTMAGAVSGIEAVLTSYPNPRGPLPLKRLLAPAIEYARYGFLPGKHLQTTLAGRFESFQSYPGFRDYFRQTQGLHQMPALANTLERLVDAGMKDFYQGELAKTMTKELKAIGSPLELTDFHEHRPRFCSPLQLTHSRGTFYNTPAPTQGAASLMLLGISDRLAGFGSFTDAQTIHCLVEATKIVFRIRDANITDPDYLPEGYREMLSEAVLANVTAQITENAQPPSVASTQGDTAWVGATDAEGLSVSSIHSLYHDFGSATVLSDTGVVWQNRGAAFGLHPGDANRLRGGARPRHTLNPAMAELSDGRRVLYGVMGGDGQPQFQSAILTQLLSRNTSVAKSVSAPRWLQGGTWGAARETLKLEAGWPDAVIAELQARGHEVEILPRYDARFGQAGVIVIHPDGEIEASSDPRSDGAAAG